MNYFLLVALALGILLVLFNLVENLKPIRIVLSPIDFHLSIYIDDILTQRSSIDQAHICLHHIQSYDIVLYRLVFIIEDVDFIEITDYFTQKMLLRQIGQRLAQHLLIGYFENETQSGIFPKYKKLENYLRRREIETVNLNQRLVRDSKCSSRKRISHSSIIVDL